MRRAMMWKTCGAVLAVAAVLGTLEARADVVGGGFLRRFFVGGVAKPQVSEINAGTGLSVDISGSRATLNVVGGGGGGGPATQIRESSGPTTLDVGAIGSGQCLVRSGSTVIGQTLAAIASSGSATDLTAGTVAYARLPVGSTAGTIAAGNDARLSDARTPVAHASSHGSAGSDPLTVTSAMVQDGTLTDQDIAAANKDGPAATPSMRTLGSGATQCLAGDTAFVDTIQDEASDLIRRRRLNMTGAGVSCTDNAGASRTDCTISGGYQTIGVNGSSQTLRGRLNFLDSASLTWAGADNAGTNSTDLTPTVVTSPAGQTPVGVTRTITPGGGIFCDGSTAACDLSANRTISTPSVSDAKAPGTVQTTDATANVSCGTAYTVPANTLAQVEINFMAMQSTFASGAYFCRKFEILNTAGTGSTLTGSPTTCGHGDNNGFGGTAAVTITRTGVTMQPVVTGVAGTTINWKCFWTIRLL